MQSISLTRRAHFGAELWKALTHLTLPWNLQLRVDNALTFYLQLSGGFCGILNPVISEQRTTVTLECRRPLGPPGNRSIGADIMQCLIWVLKSWSLYLTINHCFAWSRETLGQGTKKSKQKYQHPLVFQERERGNRYGWKNFFWRAVLMGLCWTDHGKDNLYIGNPHSPVVSEEGAVQVGNVSLRGLMKAWFSPLLIQDFHSIWDFLMVCPGFYQTCDSGLSK